MLHSQTNTTMKSCAQIAQEHVLIAQLMSLQICRGNKTLVAQLAVICLRHFPAEILHEPSEVAMDNHVKKAWGYVSAPRKQVYVRAWAQSITY